MTDGKTNFKYSSIQRKVESYSKKMQRIIAKEKNKNGIVDYEARLSNTNSKSVDIDEFTKYLVARHEIDALVRGFYRKEIFKKMKWRRQVQTKRSEQNLVENVKRTFGKDCVIGYGNWSQPQQLKNFMPTPNKGLRKILTKNFAVVDIDEYRTSKMCYNCKSETEKFIRRKARPTSKRESLVHGLLRCKNGCCKTIWNRDLNGALNIRKCLECEVKKVRRPLYLTRASALPFGKILTG